VSNVQIKDLLLNRLPGDSSANFLKRKAWEYASSRRAKCRSARQKALVPQATDRLPLPFFSLDQRLFLSTDLQILKSLIPKRKVRKKSALHSGAAVQPKSYGSGMDGRVLRWGSRAEPRALQRAPVWTLISAFPELCCYCVLLVPLNAC